METSERVALAKIYGVDLSRTTAIAQLPCGACLRRIDSKAPVAVIFRLSPPAPHREPIRDGDVGLFCPSECPGFSRCPLIEKYLRVDSFVNLEALGKGIVDKFKADDRDGDLSNVGDSDTSGPKSASVSVHIRFAVVEFNRKLNFIIPPMAEIMHKRDDGGRAGRDGSETRDEIQDGVDVHAGNSTATI